jgi:hypothetical protein
VPACRAAWQEIRIPNELAEFKAAAALWLDGRLLLLHIAPEPGIPYGPVGVVYEPPDTFRTMSETNSPSLVFLDTVVALGNELVTLAGIGEYDADPDQVVYGGRYDPETDTWRLLPPMSGNSDPTGSAMGDELFMVRVADSDASTREIEFVAYDPRTDEYRPLSRGPLSPRFGSYVWSGTEILTFGGFTFDGNLPAPGGARYAPLSDSWTLLSDVGAPSPTLYSLVWTGSEMIAWNGGGARYDPALDEWKAMSTTGAPPSYSFSLAAEGKLILWGGTEAEPPFRELDVGGVYDPASDAWTEVPTACGPGPRRRGTLTWVDDGLVFWGGSLASTCEDADDVSQCFRDTPERAWYLPRAALFGEIPSDTGACACPEPLGSDAP